MNIIDTIFFSFLTNWVIIDNKTIIWLSQVDWNYDFDTDRELVIWTLRLFACQEPSSYISSGDDIGINV